MLGSPLQTKGFSLVEILISLIIISLAAVNITGLQNKIAQQQRDNIGHAEVISLATEKMERALSFENAEQLMAMNNLSETLTHPVIGEMSLNWQVDTPEQENTMEDDIKAITLTISWVNHASQNQSFTYSSYLNYGSLFSTVSAPEKITEIEQTSSIIVSALNSNQVIYFEPTMNYQTGSFVIFDSYLYQATADHIAGDAYPHSVRDPESDMIELGEGWQSFGPINNIELANIEGLATLF